MDKKMAVIGVGNMARAIIAGIQGSSIQISELALYDKNPSQYSLLPDGNKEYVYADSIAAAVKNADVVLLSVKPQNFADVLAEISVVGGYEKKLYVTIAAGITVSAVSDALGGAEVVRVLPNLPITIGNGVTAICNSPIEASKLAFVTSIFETTGSVINIDEAEMNRIIGVTSSSPAYVFKFIDCICKAAEAQGLSSENLISTVCDVFIGSALLLKQSGEAPADLIAKVASKGGTTERAISELESAGIEEIIQKAMIACTKRADELGATSQNK